MRHLLPTAEAWPTWGSRPRRFRGQDGHGRCSPSRSLRAGAHYEAALKGREASVEISYHGCTFETAGAAVRYGGGKIGMVIMRRSPSSSGPRFWRSSIATRSVFFINVTTSCARPSTAVGPVEEALKDAESPLQREAARSRQRNAQRLCEVDERAAGLRAALKPVVSTRPTSRSILRPSPPTCPGAFRSAIEVAGLRLVVDCPPLPDGVDVYVES